MVILYTHILHKKSHVKEVNVQQSKLTENSPKKYYINYEALMEPSGFGGLGVACWPLVPKFAGSNPAEAIRFLRAKKSSACLPSEGK